MDGIRAIRPVLALVVLLCALIMSAAAVPPLPAEFYGSVTQQGNPVQAGTVLTAKINDQICGQYTLKEAGKYGGAGIFDDKLMVVASENDLKIGPLSVNFFIGDTKADQVVPFESGKVQKLDMSAGGSPSGIVADFEGTPTNGAAPLTVKFTDRSTGNPTMWNWDFGDGVIPMDASCSGDVCNNIANPIHTYNTPGTYTVKLTASSQIGGTSVKEKVGYITVSGSGAGPKASFTADKRSGPNPLTVQFTDTSSGSPTMWFWDFGDGTNASIASPSHTYQQAGVYTVKLTSSSQQGTDTKTEKDFIAVTGDIPPPVAMFEATPLSGSAPLTVKFTDLSIGPPTTYYWDFGDTITSNEVNPSHTYTGPGSYTVTLTVSNSGGSHTMKRDNYILVGGSPSGVVADFEGAPTSGAAPLTVKFTDKSTGSPTMWIWDFGDGVIPMDASCSGDSCNNIANPIHTYTAPGVYTVKLTASSQTGGVSTKTKEGYITVSQSGGVIADFEGTPTSGGAPLTVKFTDKSTGGPTMWIWDFGDGVIPMDASCSGDSCNNIANPIHTYTAPGVYTVKLTASSQTGGVSTKTREGYITVSQSGSIIADFSGTPTAGSVPLTVQFSDRSIGGPIMWAWDFGDGGTDMVANPSHVYRNPGTYTVKLTASNTQSTNSVTKSGYISASQPGPGGSVKITYAPDRSQVYLNNQLQGETRFLQTFRIGNLPGGVNQLRITKPGFTDYIKDVSVEAGKEIEVIADMKIKPTNNGIVSVYTYPAGSSVYVDGNLAGTGPLWLADVTPGVHSLRVTSPNYLDWNQQVNVVGGGSVTYVTAALYPSWWLPQYGYVMISSLPSGGLAYLDGVAQGNTPLTLSQVKPGVHTVRVELAGYQPFEQQVNVMEGRTAYVIAQLSQGGVIPMSAMSAGS
ncbi:PKD domain-containing protein [uncultured Methanospirillum sp.]|uniref:PKD domain-containing protein n=1 Tax=uncultured Methanospirillum sp. TaxID=262503 RepID=UPI0029C875FB|nr:PKD domain-containing protein [uncultured Methanospirillum sp.]